MNIGPTIRKLREAKNVTQEYMATRLKIGVTAYGNIERNDVKRLTVARVLEIAAILNVHYSEIFGSRDKQVPDPEGKLKIDAVIMGMMDYFRKDKQLLCEMLKVYNEIYTRMDLMLQDHNKGLQKVMKMQLEIHESLMTAKRQTG